MSRRWGEFDFGDMKELKKKLKDMRKDLPSVFFYGCLQEIALLLLSKVVPRTPVDTGELRSKWTIGQILKVRGGWQIEVINPVEYAPYVEYGHRGVYVPELGVTLHVDTHWTEGKFMLTISEKEVEVAIPRIIQKRLDHLLKTYLRW
jgi:hypothetical protein